MFVSKSREAISWFQKLLLSVNDKNKNLKQDRKKEVYKLETKNIDFFEKMVIVQEVRNYILSFYEWHLLNTENGIKNKRCRYEGEAIDEEE